MKKALVVFLLLLLAASLACSLGAPKPTTVVGPNPPQVTIEVGPEEMKLEVGDDFCWKDPVPSPAEWRCFKVTGTNPPSLKGDYPFAIVETLTKGEYEVREGDETGPSMFWLEIVNGNLIASTIEEFKKK